MLKSLHKLEHNEKVKVIYASEVGSRAYGLASLKSDYDVRFIYIHHPEWYLSIDNHRDVIDNRIHKNIELSGWELTKALRLFRKSNPSMMEWLHSPIIYDKDERFSNEINHLIPTMFAPVSTLYHYIQMTKRNINTISKYEHATPKQYVHTIRPLLMCMWIRQHGHFPPLLINELLNDVHLPVNVQLNMERLCELKRNGEEAVTAQPRLLRFIQDQVVEMESYVKELGPKNQGQTEPLNHLFRQTLYRQWESFFE
ncbi:hypothetical protein N784_15890 [Pontibacillus litoralis JSM 072002]|uniref:Nucleotidyltransferase n=1 Tax=Pontibacillus litoralis JSM 072002 TaxID=1385512 RepID=A0A0A5G880_9BACI|nr:hypothetical protein N784_15890 [Pontibacillus litoralis JSM 072002]